VDYNPLNPEVRKDPYPHYEALRRDAPAYQVPDLGIYAISRYDDVAFVLNNPAIFSSTGYGTNEINGQETAMMISVDPPDHTRLRNLVNRAFTPRMVADLEPRIRELVAELLDGIAPRGEMDLIADFAVPLPVTIIAEILGVPAEDKEDFKRWSDSVVNNMGPHQNSEEHERQMDAFIAYLHDAIEQRRRQPGDDMLGTLVKAEADTTLTENEVIMFAILLLVAGNETTTNLIGNMMRALLANPDRMELVRNDRSLVQNTVEEALRYDAPVQLLPRQTTRDVEIGGTTIPAGAPLVPIFGSANRDERRYPDAQRFDVTRNTQGHLAFGHGIHFCLGAPLARLEASIALEAILARLDNIALDQDEVELIGSPFLRGPKRLQLAFEPSKVEA